MIGAGVVLPSLGFAVLPSFEGEGVATHDVDLGPVSNFPEGTFVITTFIANKAQGEVSKRTAYIRNNGLSANKEPSFTIIYSRCVHLGCPVQPNGPRFEDQKKTYKDVTLTPVQPAGFGCPCHGGAYDTEGNRTAGPPVRSLDRYAFSIVNGNLVLGKHFSVGTVAGHRRRRQDQPLPAELSRRARRRHRALALSHPGAGVLTMAKSARQKQIETAALYPLDWVEERTGLVGYTKWFLFRNVPRDVNWMQTLGAATLTAFLVQATTGVFLAMYYKPDPNSAYESIQNITHELTLGWLVRGMHKWGASVFIILMFLHMARTFLFGAYKYPRELNWIIGVLLLVTGMARGLHRLPAALGPDGLLGDGGRHQPQRHRTDSRALPRPVPPGRLADRAGHAVEVLLAAHARDPRRPDGADRPSPVPRRPARRHLAAVVAGAQPAARATRSRRSRATASIARA